MKVYFIRRHKRFFILSQKLQLIWQWNAHTSRVQHCTSSNIQFYLLLSANSKKSGFLLQQSPFLCKMSPVHSFSDDNDTNAVSSIFACLYLCSKSGKHKSASPSSNCSSNYSPVKWLWKRNVPFCNKNLRYGILSFCQTLTTRGLLRGRTLEFMHYLQKEYKILSSWPDSQALY